MKLSKKGLIVGMVTTGLLSAGSAFGLVNANKSTITADPATYDQAIYLYWGKDSTTTNIAGVTGLMVGKPQYRYLSVTPKSTSALTGDVTVTFTLSANEGAFMDGLVVKVYKIDAITGDVDNESIKTAIGETIASAQVNGALHDVDEDKTVLTEAKATDTVSFSVADRSEDLYSYNYYGLEFTYDGYQVEGKTMGATLNITQTFAETE